ncbi:MAG TPA: chromosomal replication initiator protein DnaA [Solirubrobacteraceae bacterium]|nr:chromosomal replication initiator protein DnaA [Solirubrobacteraceae bacterium]
MSLPAQSETPRAWHEIRAELRRSVGDSAYELWLSAVEAQESNGDLLVLRVPADTHTWVVGRYGRIIESCVARVAGPSVRVSFTTPGGSRGQHRNQPAADARGAGATLNPRFSFDQFVIGDGNRLAHAASLTVAELPGQAYNPLFLHAPPGLGKTHLLHAIANYVLAYGGGATVKYATVEAFTNHFISALSSRKIDDFKRTYRNADVLLIDDVQFLASKAKTEEEFFHTFNALYESGRQLVLTCDRLPRDLANIEERLRERFESGLVADISPPDFATRLTILSKRAALDRIELGDQAVLELIATRITSNIRVLEGALIRIVAFHSLTGRPIDLELATEVLDRLLPATKRGAPAIPAIQAAVAAHFGISVKVLVSASRIASIAWPRQIAMHLSRTLTEASLPTIGQAFGGRSHATVVHACRRVADQLDVDNKAADTVSAITAAILDPNDRGD